MNFALLGGDAALLPLLRTIAASEQHALRMAAGVPSLFSKNLLSTCPAVQLVDTWDEFLGDNGTDAVIAVEGSTAGATVDEGIKRLAAAGTPMLLLPGGDPASSLVYELSLIRDDTQVPVIPLFPMRFFPPLGKRKAESGKRKAKSIADEENAESGTQKPDGAASQPSTPPLLSVTLERRLAVERTPPLLSPADVYRALVYDADLLRQIGGEYTQVTALFAEFQQTDTDEPSTDEPSTQGIAMATVTLGGKGLPMATWTLHPANDGHSFEIGMTTEDGTQTTGGELAPGEIPEAGFNTLLSPGRGAANEGNSKTDAAVPDVPTAILDDFIDTVQSKRQLTERWKDVTRAFEVVEAASRSVRRRRTIDLHFETTSERSQFKTQMTAIGCGLMSMTLFSVVFLLLAENVFNLHPIVMNVAWVGVFLPLVLFLLLQLLLFVSRPSRDEEAVTQQPTESS